MLRLAMVFVTRLMKRTVGEDNAKTEMYGVDISVDFLIFLTTFKVYDGQ